MNGDVLLHVDLPGEGAAAAVVEEVEALVVNNPAKKG